jgi:type IV pilus assembly protein PilY1
MKRIVEKLKSLTLGLALSTALFPALYSGQALAVVSTYTIADFTSYPVIATDDAVTPFVMLAMSNDHQLFFKAYNDYTDIDGDGTIETTYKHSFDYYGYFDSYKCYSYNTTNGRFEPAAVTANKYCDTVSGDWSGNFLNWASMTRMDAMRKIFFGGYRRTDSSTTTVLERSFLPADAHAFAKYYNGTDISKLTPFSVTGGADTNSSGITLCNVTFNSTLTSASPTANSSSSSSNGMASPPLIRVAKGNYSLWAGNERWQCTWSDSGSEQGSNSNGNVAADSGINAHSSDPGSTDKLGEYIDRIQVCVSGLEESNCKEYPTSTHEKPTGLLQKYGDDDTLYFGLFSGSYQKNKSGGVLIKNIGTITDEIDVTGDGHFTKVASSASDNGVPSNQAEGIINAMSLYRIVDYYYKNGTYSTSANGNLNNNDCGWGNNSFSDGQCVNWGNPIAEIYLNALRYLAGDGVAGEFRSNSSPPIDGLPQPATWSCPLSSTNSCAALNIVTINASTISYDGDQLDGTSYGVQNLGATKDSAGLTDEVGDGENITGNDWFIGDADGTAANIDKVCTAKTISNLGSSEGVCTDAPRLNGTYKIAGLAQWAHLNDIRSASGVDDLTGKQTVDSYAVALAATPEISIPVPGSSSGQTVKILPACQNTDVQGNCALVDFKIVQSNTEDPLNPGEYTGKFYVNWEDSEQGGDFDQDMWGTIEYRITSSTIEVTTNVDAESTIYKMGFGYVISGTDKDGFHVHSGIENYSYDEPNDPSDTLSDCESPCNVGDAATSNTYNIGSSSASLLKDPLWYAAKWGGFTDENGNNIPDLQSEWDQYDTDGNSVQDGIPDNYFYVADPQGLEDSLTRVFEDILGKTASGTAAAVVASSREGLGALYQALYETSKKDNNDNEVSWIGSLHALWIDENGYMREDGDGDATLDGYDVDPVIEIYYDSNAKTTKLKRYTSSSATSFVSTGYSTHKLSDLKPLWNARDTLSALSSSSITTQRTYSTTAQSGRHILTWIDSNRDGVTDSSEVIDFTSSNISSSNYQWFDVASQTDAQNIVDFIRGKEGISGFRSRTVDYDGDGNTEVMRLGDIISSTPTVVAAPAEAYDLLYGDDTYAKFRERYAQRRQVVYVGANDGMLHAFNGGFYNPSAKKFQKQSVGGSEVQHDLGTELWAYVPEALLPHLKWLTDPDYTHVYYVDGKPRVFDAKIFSDSTDPDTGKHPYGWGTVLVVGMRLGGGEMLVDTGDTGYNGGTNKNKSTTFNGNSCGYMDLTHPTSKCDDDDMSFSSAYLVLDITDPESEPTVLAEIVGDIGYTTSYPTVAAVRDADNSADNSWYLIFGNGPTALNSATSSQNGRIYAWDLVNRTWATGFGPSDTGNKLSNSSFVGDPVTTDWDLNFKAESVYFGTMSGTAASPAGSLYKLTINEDIDPTNWTGPSVFANVGQPVATTPSLSFDELGNHWVYFGTGRLFVEGDKSSTAKQSLYGLIDAAGTSRSTSLPALTDVVDVTSAQVFSDGSLTGVSGATTFSALESMIDGTDGNGGKDGWKIDLCTGSQTTPCARMVTPPSLLGQVLLDPVYTPNTNICEAEGTAELYGVYYKTGTALANPSVFGTDSTSTNNGYEESIRVVDLGKGIASTPSVHVGAGTNNNEETVFIQTSTGAIQKQTATLPGAIKSGEASWREITE